MCRNLAAIRFRMPFLVNRWGLCWWSLQFSSAQGADQELTYDMPTYQYRCTTCDNQFEVRQSFTDDPISACVVEGCDGEVKKVFGNVGIAFKGSGFYKNDSRSSSKQSDSSSSTSDNKTSSKTTESSASTSGSADKSAKTDTKKASD